jgi:hypothetical protein
MYYLSATKEVVADLPLCNEGYSAEKLLRAGVLVYKDGGGSPECPIKGDVVSIGDIAIQSYIDDSTLSKLKDRKKKILNRHYENGINAVVRKSTQDLLFGDIEAIPQEVIDQRKALKEEYHQKVNAIDAAKDVFELNVTTL